jgi:hypothetical protein
VERNGTQSSVKDKNCQRPLQGRITVGQVLSMSH